jgi:hypothetical protein
MTTTPYSYCLLRYVHDPAAGEILNIGVALYAPSAPYIGVRVEHRYERLSRAFAGFDSEHYRRTLAQFEAAVERIRERWQENLFGLPEMPGDVTALAAQVWPDPGLSFRLGPAFAGVADEVDAALESLFERLVTSQCEHPKPQSRSDEEVWAVYQPVLAREHVTRALRPKRFETPELELEFPHAFKNERWHALQPLSMDYTASETLQTKAARWVGAATALKDSPEMGRLYVLLGAPQSDAHEAAYERAKRFLRKMPIEHELIEERDADAFARQLADNLRQHGLLDG